MKLLISGYGDNSSMGLFEIENKFNSIKNLWSCNLPSPSFICHYCDILFAASEQEDCGIIYCFQRLGDQYFQTDKIQLNGGLLCHLRYSPKHKTLYGSFYGTGHLCAINVENYKFAHIISNNILDEKLNLVSRAHCTITDREENHLFCTNISMDKLFCFDIDNGNLSLNSKSPFFQFPVGEGVRHIQFHPTLSIAYVITEYSNKIFTLSYDINSDHFFKIIQEISILPNGYSNQSFGSSIAINSIGSIIYAANRGADTIAVFEVNKNGLLKKVQDFNGFGRYPRHITISRNQKYLITANQNSNNVSYISISASGQLLKQVYSIPFTMPSCVTEI